MALTCGECGAVNGRGGAVVNAVCHHCGKLLCRRHQVALLDSAFKGKRSVPPVAIHCAACSKTHNPIVRRIKVRSSP